MSDAAQRFAVLVKEFGGEGAAADARAVGLEDAVHLSDARRCHAESGADACAHRIGRGDEGIGAEIDVEKGALCAFGQDGRALVEGFVDIDLAFDECETLHFFDSLHPPFLVVGDVELEVILCQQTEMLILQGVILALEFRGQDVAYAQAVTAGLVHIGRTYALEGGADLGLALGGFARGVEHAMGGEDKVCALGDDELVGDDAGFLLDGADLVHQDHGVDDDSVADDVDSALAENAGGDGVKHESVAVKDQ